jgi:RNA polymerase sigma-70 factor (family 1)
MPSYSTIHDEVLFSLMKAGEGGAFKEIYERYFDSLFLHACRKLRSKEEARDAVQETFAALWDKRDRISLTGSLAGYLFTAVRNRILNIIAHKQVESLYVSSLQRFLEAGTCQTDYLVRSNQLNSLIEKEMAALPTRMKEIFTLSRREHLSHSEIAEHLNLSEQTVKKQVTNALKILKTKLSIDLVK